MIEMEYTSVYYVLQSQKVATGYANNKIHKEVVKIDI